MTNRTKLRRHNNKIRVKKNLIHLRSSIYYFQKNGRNQFSKELRINKLISSEPWEENNRFC